MLARRNGKKKEEPGLKTCKMGCREVVKKEVVKTILGGMLKRLRVFRKGTSKRFQDV